MTAPAPTGNPAFDAARAQGVIDTFLAMPSERAEQTRKYDNIRELAMKLMLKWPNLYYSTSAFAPKHYPKAIVDYANSRGADKVMYAGYFPAGLSYDRIFEELPKVPFKDEVWPKFLRENAKKVLKL
jgi:predicted TIM-barrel fold metal-dependent hydrolase